ncbi:uncharacterized protein LOC144582812 [Callithrix jacchus]
MTPTRGPGVQRWRGKASLGAGALPRASRRSAPPSPAAAAGARPVSPACLGPSPPDLNVPSRDPSLTGLHYLTLRTVGLGPASDSHWPISESAPPPLAGGAANRVGRYPRPIHPITDPRSVQCVGCSVASCSCCFASRVSAATRMSWACGESRLRGGLQREATGPRPRPWAGGVRARLCRRARGVVRAVRPGRRRSFGACSQPPGRRLGWACGGVGEGRGGGRAEPQTRRKLSAGLA